MSGVWILAAAGAAMFLVIGGLAMLSHHYTLNGIKSRTVGDGQHGTARWATKKEIQSNFKHIPFQPLLPPEQTRRILFSLSEIQNWSYHPPL